MASKVGTFCIFVFVCCCPGGRRGNKEQVVAQWRRPVASGKTLFMLHWVMQHVPHQHLRMTSPVGIEKDGGHDGWLCWGWRVGVADYWGTKNEKREGKNLVCGRG